MSNTNSSGNIAVKLLGKDFLDKYPLLFSGGTIANMLGYNIFRTLYMNLWRTKPSRVSKEYQKYADILEKDGIVVIPDFFPKEQFDAIKKEFDELYAGWSPFDFNEKDFSKRQNDFPEYFKTIAEKIVTPETPAFTEYFLKNPFINELATSVVHRKSRITPYHHFWFLQRRNLDGENVGYLHTAAYPHADVFYPTIKVFLYLNDVDESNAAYIYAKGSHKLSIKRLWFEYKLSIKYSRTKDDRVTDEELAKIGFYPESICGKANTLFISNNMGYHNRGDFSNLKPRQTAQLDFRHLETWRNTLFRNEKDIFSRLSRKFVKSFDKSLKQNKLANISNNNMS
ncbi:MAG: hypothetical protein HGGPFJEG_01276 [Ignavibacteria bacterium]|nr:hypothetical protein [Ignavibacteria bacterium]